MTWGAFFPTGQRCGADWASAAPNSRSNLCFCSTMSEEAEGKPCMLSAIGRLAAWEPVEVVLGMRLQYHQGWGRQSLQMVLGAESNAGDHKPKSVYPDRRDRIGRQHLPITPHAPNLHPLLLPSHSRHWPILISVQHHLQPVSLSTYISSPARRFLHYTFIISASPALQECLLIRWFVIYCVPSLLAAWEVHGEQEHKTHSNGILSSLVTTQRTLLFKTYVYSGFCLNTILMCWHIIDLSRHNFLAKRRGMSFIAPICSNGRIQTVLQTH